MKPYSKGEAGLRRFIVKERDKRQEEVDLLAS